ncbi:MAG: DMT family transporter [Thermoleophilia bacterium]
MLAVMLALAASLAYGTSDFIAGLQSRRRSVWSVTAVSQPTALFLAGVILVLQWSPPAEPRSLLIPFIGGIAGGCGIVAYYLALAQGTMSVVSPIVAACALVPVVVGLAGGERASGLQYAGMAMALFGIVLTSRTEARSTGRVGLRSVALALGAAVGFGAMMVGLSASEGQDVSWIVFCGRLGSATAVYAYIIARRPRLDVPLRAAPVLAAVGVLGVAANLLFALATTMGYLSVVSVLATLSPVVIAVCARLFIGERLTRAQLVAAAIVLAGVAVLSV